MVYVPSRYHFRPRKSTRSSTEQLPVRASVASGDNAGDFRQNESMDDVANRPKTTEPRIVSTPGTCGGKPRIAGHRVTVKHIVLEHQRGGMSPDEIVSAYPGLTPADVDAALAYYSGNRDAIDADIRADDEHWAEVREQNPDALTDRLRRRKAEVANNPRPPR